MTKKDIEFLNEEILKNKENKNFLEEKGLEIVNIKEFHEENSKYKSLFLEGHFYEKNSNNKKCIMHLLIRKNSNIIINKINIGGKEYDIDNINAHNGKLIHYFSIKSGDRYIPVIEKEGGIIGFDQIDYSKDFNYKLIEAYKFKIIYDKGETEIIEF